MYKRFNSFESLVEDFKTRDAAAIRYEAEDGSVRDISYKELAQRISSESFHVKAACSTVEVIRYELDPDSLVDIFAHVIAGCDIIIADSRMPEEYNKLAMEAAEKARFMRETQRDERGRIRGRQGEGELLFFTSGTTSRSKIVRLTSASVCASAWSGQKMLACGEGDVLLSVLTLSHAYGVERPEDAGLRRRGCAPFSAHSVARIRFCMFNAVGTRIRRHSRAWPKPQQIHRRCAVL